MVKVQKPNPKSIKKDVNEKTKKIQMKKMHVNSSKKEVKKVGKTLQIAAKNGIVKDETPKNTVLNKMAEKVEEAAVKKKPFTAQVQKVGGKAILKKKAIVAEVQHGLKKTAQKKASIVPKVEKKSPIAAKVGNRNQIKAKAGNKKSQKEEVNRNVEASSDEITSPIFEPVNFDDDKFWDILSLENIKKISKALKVIVEKEVAAKKTSIFSDYRYIMNISCYKIANCPKRMVKLNLKHSLVDTKTDDVVMIVPDLERGAKVDYEPTIQHYEDMFREIGVDNIKIVPFNQLRKEFSSFEAKRKFAKTYDYFLCDGRIVGHVVGFCGKHFQKPRTAIHAVRLDNPKTYKTSIEHALKRTSFRQLHKGDMTSIPVGNHLFTISQLAENIKDVIKQLENIFPGGYANIHNIYIKIDIKGTSSLPLYVNLAGAPADVPNVIGPREQRMLKLKKEANEILSKFNMSKTGDFVKLNKAQAKRKQKIHESRAALLSKGNIEDDVNNSEIGPLKKKVKKDEQIAANSNSGDDNSDNANQEDSEISDEE